MSMSVSVCVCVCVGARVCVSSLKAITTNGVRVFQLVFAETMSLVKCSQIRSAK